MWKKIVAILTGIIIGYWLIDDFNPDKVRGKRVLVTGASTGIGEQLAYHYARLGANVVVTARRENRLQEVVAKCRELGVPDGQYGYVVADMAQLNSTESVIQGTVNMLGGLDYIVLNHIKLLDLWHWMGTAANLTLLDDVLTVNYRSYVHLASHALPYLERSNGSIVVVSSFAGKVSQPFVSVYSASKFALDGFFSSLRQELKIRNCDVSVTMCIIGFIATENSLKQLRDYGQDFLISTVYQASPADTALAIIKELREITTNSNRHLCSGPRPAVTRQTGGAARVRELYYPYMQVKPMLLLRDWLPGVVDYANLYLYTRTS